MSDESKGPAGGAPEPVSRDPAKKNPLDVDVSVFIADLQRDHRRRPKTRFGRRKTARWRRRA